MANLDKAVPARDVDGAPRTGGAKVYRPAQPPTHRFRWLPPGWTVLILFGALIFLWAYVDSRQAVPIEPISIDTWACTDPIEPDAAWSSYLRAGCTRAEVDAELAVMQGAGALPGASRSGDRWWFERVPVESFELAIQVDTDQPRQAVVLGHTNDGVPSVVGELNSDAADQRFTSPFRPEGGTRFLILFGPAQEP